MLFEAVSILSYLALVLAVTLPGVSGEESRRGAVLPYRAAGRAAFLCALCAAFFVPWSGVGVLPFRTWPFYPLLGLSFFLNARPRGAGLPFLVSLATFALLTGRFVLSRGLPGDRWGIESASMILRLESIGSARLSIAMLCFFVSLFFSFLGACRDDAAGRAAAFAFSALLALVFVPVDAADLLGLFPPLSVALNVLFSFVAALVFLRGIRLLAGRGRGARKGRFAVAVALPIVAALAGGCLLLASP